MVVFELRYIFLDPEEVNARCFGYFTSSESARACISALEKEREDQAVPHKCLIIPQRIDGIPMSVNRIYVARVEFESQTYLGRETHCLGIFEDREKALSCTETFTKLMDPEFSENLTCAVSVSEYILNCCTAANKT